MINITTLADSVPEGESLREGEFFRVKLHARLTEIVEVQLRKKLKPFGSKELGSWSCSLDQFEYATDVVTYCAAKALDDARRASEVLGKHDFVRRNYAGDHYPERG